MDQSFVYLDNQTVDVCAKAWNETDIEK